MLLTGTMIDYAYMQSMYSYSVLPANALLRDSKVPLAIKFISFALIHQFESSMAMRKFLDYVISSEELSYIRNFFFDTDP